MYDIYVRCNYKLTLWFKKSLKNKKIFLLELKFKITEYFTCVQKIKVNIFYAILILYYYKFELLT